VLLPTPSASWIRASWSSPTPRVARFGAQTALFPHRLPSALPPLLALRLLPPLCHRLPRHPLSAPPVHQDSAYTTLSTTLSPKKQAKTVSETAQRDGLCPPSLSSTALSPPTSKAGGLVSCHQALARRHLALMPFLIPGVRSALPCGIPSAPLASGQTAATCAQRYALLGALIRERHAKGSFKRLNLHFADYEDNGAFESLPFWSG